MKMFTPRALTPLLLTLVLMSSSLTTLAEEYTLDMRGVDIREFISTISKMTGKTIITDDKVRGKVDIQSPSTLTEQELYEIFLVQLGINGYSVVDAGSNILKVIPSQGAKLEGSDVSQLIPERSSEEIVTRVVEVRNVNANQLAATLRPLIDNRLGIIAAYDTSNVILITDRASNVRRIAQIIGQVDQADSQTLELIPLSNASASEMERILTSLMNETQKDKSGPAPMITSDKRTNTLIVKADATTRSRIGRIAKELDSEVQTNSNTRVVYLKYAKASDLVPVLQGISDTIIKEETGQQAGAASTSQSSLHIDAHDQTNTIVMSGSPHIIKTIEDVITKLDIRRAQVLVEAIIAEVSEDASRELGVQWLFFDADDGSTTPLGAVNLSTDNTSGIADIVAAATSDSASTSLVGNGLSVGIGQFNSNGFSFAAFLNALDEDTDSNVLSTPSLVTMDNEEAYIQVGQEVPIITGSTASSDNTNPFQTIERKDIGVMLKVTPQINEGDAIRLTLEQEVSSLSGAVASDIITNKRVISTTVLVDDGATLVLGGLINEDVQDTSYKVPLLGDIPFVGRAFRSDTSTREKRTLMVFIRPTIIRDRFAATEISREKYNYIHARQVLNSQRDNLFPDGHTPSLPAWEQSKTSPMPQENTSIPVVTAPPKEPAQPTIKAPASTTKQTTNNRGDIFQRLDGDF
ncbi:type II secretion system secretin GspD [Neptunomonas phycophila]|uniref:type II secretion system secretin GspD n=1 Tax=Neptunomonas phycophila TaxID=1572645 RepID=UPI0026E3722F|nr:type II secretion system secretin GspD [Neptunomonas phycophila]MDO6784682.1 type II secretion system secretin GspD [Neptunomonas phycophila]